MEEQILNGVLNSSSPYTTTTTTTTRILHPTLATQAPAPARPTHMQHRDTLVAGRPFVGQQEGTHAMRRNV